MARFGAGPTLPYGETQMNKNTRKELPQISGIQPKVTCPFLQSLFNKL